MLCVQRKAFLGAVGPDEVRRQALDRAIVAARSIATARTLDLDDPCAELGELTRCERAGDDLFERDDGDAVKGALHGKAILSPVLNSQPLCRQGAAPLATDPDLTPA